MKGFTKGFILAEVCIALMIVGIIGSMTLPLLNQAITWKKTIETQERIERSLKLLGQFVLKNFHLPPPKTRMTCEEEGDLPYKELGMNECDAKDGAGKVIRYRVAHPLCLPKFHGLQPKQRELGYYAFCASVPVGLGVGLSGEEGAHPVIIQLRAHIHKNEIIKSLTFDHFMAIYAKPCEAVNERKR